MRAPALLLSLLVACTADAEDLNPWLQDTPPRLPTTGDTFVVDRLTVGASEGDLYGANSVDVDGDGTVENRLGEIVLFPLRADPLAADAAVGAGVADGEILHLLALGDIDADYLETVRIFLGVDTDDEATNNHSGDAQLAIRPASVRDAAAFGVRDAVGEGFSYRAGTMVFETRVFGPLALPLTSVVIEGTIREDGSIGGRLGGALAFDDVEGRLKPALVGSIATALARDCSGVQMPACCEPASEGEYWLGVLNFAAEPPVCSYDAEEIAASSVLDVVLYLDLDLDGDGEEDAMSVGFGFTAVPARFEF